MTPPRRPRLQLLLLLGVFAAPFLLALLLVRGGWLPGTKSYGTPVLPQRSLLDAPVTLVDGGRYAWKDAKPRWTLAVLPGPDCAAACARELALLQAVRVRINKKDVQLRLLYLGAPPADAQARALLAGWAVGRDDAGRLAAFRPARADSLAAVLVEPDGTALTAYPAGYDAELLLKDLQKAIK